ncbi:MAG: PEGA domain-containing protein [Planctomycetaceae bacterium]
MGLTWCTLAGCVRRRLTIRSNPPGALVYVDDQEIGVTPASTPFTYYGTRKIQIFADGYEPLTVKQPMTIPWYEIPPLDFFFENLWPFELRDEREVQFDLLPQQVVPNEKLIERAEQLRGNLRAGVVTPLPATANGPLPATAAGAP